MSAIDITGLVFSVIGVVVLFQMGCDFVHSYLPEQCLKAFNDTLSDTDSIYQAATEEGLDFGEEFSVTTEKELLR